MTVQVALAPTLPQVAGAESVRRFFRKTFAVQSAPILPWRDRKVDAFFANAFQTASMFETKPCGTGGLRAGDLFSEFVWD